MNNIDLFLDELRLLPSYQNALSAKEKILQRSDLMEQFRSIQQLQKSMVRKFASSNQVQYQNESSMYQDALSQMESHPLVAEYLASLQEVQSDINFLSNILKAPNLEL